MCSVAILFIADNMNHLLGDYIVGGVKVMALISFGRFLSMFVQFQIIFAYLRFDKLCAKYGDIKLIDYRTE